jgi:Ca2+-binding RTX toxin-like protein
MAKRAIAPQITLAAPSPDASALRLTFTGVGKANADIFLFDDLNNDGKWDRKAEPQLATGQAGADGVWTLATDFLTEGQHHFRWAQHRPTNLASQASSLDYLPAAKFLTARPDVLTLFEGKDGGDRVAYTLKGAPNASVQASLNPLGDIDAARVAGLPSAPIVLDAAGLGALTLTIQADGIAEKQQSLRVNFATADGVNIVAQAIAVNESIRLSADRSGLFEGEVGADSVSYTVQGTPGASVNLSLAEGTAQAADIGGLPASVVLGAGGTARFVLTALGDALAEGDETLIVVAEDGGDRFVADPVVIHDGLAAPTLVAIENDTGASATDRVTQDAAPTLRGTAAGSVAQVQVSLDGAALGLAPVTDGAWSFPSPVLADGLHTFEFRSVAANGFTGQASSMADVTIDSAPPAPARVNPLNTTDLAPTITGTWSGAPGDSLVVTIAGVAYVPVTDGPNWSVTLPSGTRFPVGVFDVVAQTTDASGNVSADTTANELTVRVVNPPAILAFLDDTGADPNDHITRDDTPALSGTADGGALRVNVYEGGVLAGSADANGGAWSFAGGPLDDGLHSFVAKSVDASGAETDASPPFAIAIDTQAPVAATVNPLVTDDPTPTLSGTWSGEPGDKLSIAVAGKLYAPATSGTNWSVTLPAADALANGNYDVAATTTDLAGNASQDATANELKIMTADTPVIVSFADDTGIDSADRLTNDNTPALNGTAGGDAESVNIYLNGLKAGTAAVNGGAWSFASEPLSDGAHSFSAKSVGASGKESGSSAPLSIAIDTLPPLAATVDPLNAQDSTPTLTGTWSGASGDALSVAVNGKTYAPVTVGTAWRLDLPDMLAPGVYDAIATTTDRAGNASQDATLNELTVRAPLVPVIVSFADDTGADANDHVTRDDTPTLSGIASDQAVQIVLYRDGVAVGATVPSGGVWSFDSASLADGAYAFAATALAANGKESEFSAPFALTIDTRPPATPAVDPLVTTDATPTLTGTWNGGLGETLSVSVNGKTYAPTVSGAQWSVTVPDADKLNPGAFDILARAEDQAGNFSADATLGELTVQSPDTPIIQLLKEDTGADAADRITFDDTPTLSGTVGEKAALVKLYRDGVAVGTAVPSGGVWSFDSAPLADGAYAFAATALAANGKESEFSAPFALTIDMRPPATPIVDPLVTTDATPTLTGTWNGGLGETLSVSVNGKTYAPAFDGDNWRVTVPEADKLNPGAFDVLARAEDQAGNFSADATLGELTVTALNAPVITGFADDAGASPNDRITNDNAPSLNGTADGKAAQVNILRDGVLVGTAPATNGAWNFDSPPLPDGAYSFAAQGLDANGLKSDVSAPFAVTIDTAAPATPVVNSLSTTDATPDLSGSWKAGPDETFSVSVNGKTYTPSFAGDNWSVTVPDGDALNPGVYDVVAKAVDLAGNASQDTTQNELVIVANTPPLPSPSPRATFTGTAGDDTIPISVVQLQGAPIVDGLAGTDTLAVSDAGAVIDDSMFQNFAPNSMEILSLSGAGAQSVTLGPNWDAAFNSKVEAPNATSLTLNAAATNEGITVIGTPNTDTIAGGGGGDTLDGGGGIDTLAGGNRDDVYYVDDVNDTVTEKANEGTQDRIVTTVDYTLSANVEQGFAFAADITLTGNDMSNILQVDAAVTGGVTLDGGPGSVPDTLIGGVGDDRFYVATRPLDGSNDDGDRIDGGGGFNILFVNGYYTPDGTMANPSIQDDDMLKAVQEVKLLSLGKLNLSNQMEGFQIFVFNDSNGNVVIGGQGADDIRSGGGDDLFGDASLNLNGADDNDIIDGGGNTDPMSGGGDKLWLNKNYFPEDANLENVEIVDASPNVGITINLSKQIEDFTVNLASDPPNSNSITSGAGNDRLLAFNGSGTNILAGGDGDDTLIGGSGFDDMRGGNGNDIIDGTGNASIQTDKIDGGMDFDKLILTGNYTPTVSPPVDPDSLLQGVDEINLVFPGKVDLSSQTEEFKIFVLNDGAGNHVIGGQNKDSITGQGGDDRLEGGGGQDIINGGTTDGLDGNDTLDGGDGDDILVGGTGTDSVSGGNGDDTFGDPLWHLNGADNGDTIDGNAGTSNRLYLTQSYTPTDDSHLQNIQLVDIESGIGGQTIDLSNQSEAFTVKVMNANGITVNTGDGADIIYGQGENDHYSGGRGNDYIEGGSGDDNIDGGDNDDIILGGVGNDIIAGGDGADDIAGGPGADNINPGTPETGVDIIRFNAADEVGDIIINFNEGSGQDHDVIAFADGLFDGANYIDAMTFGTLTTVAVAGGSGENIAGADAVLYTPDSPSITTGDVDALLAAQAGTFSGGVLFAVDDGSFYAYLFYDAHANVQDGNVTLIATLDSVSDVTALTLSNFQIASIM